MVVFPYILSFLCISFLVFILVKGIIRAAKNARGYQLMEEDRKVKGLPYFGQDDEELEKEMYDIWD